MRKDTDALVLFEYSSAEKSVAGASKNFVSDF